MSKWQALEAWIRTHGEKSFSNRKLAASLGLASREATDLIQSYLGAQRRPNSPTAYVLKRKGRTINAVWSVGQQGVDRKAINRSIFGDVEAKLLRAFRPDLQRLGQINPAERKQVETTIHAVVDGALLVLAAALNVNHEEE